MSRALLLLCLASCGSFPGQRLTVEEPPTGGPEFRLEGACSPSAVSRSVTAPALTMPCSSSMLPPTLLESEAELAQVLGQGCFASTLNVDFTSQRALFVAARGASEWFVQTNFVHERDDAVEVGLVIRPQGAPPPDVLLLLPRNGKPVELRWCRSVCVARCDQALP